MSSAAEQEAVVRTDAATAGAVVERVAAAAPGPHPPAVWPGAPMPLGARFRTGPDGVAGTNFALWAGGAEAVELCLFDEDGTETRLALTELTHEVWHGFVPGVRPGRMGTATGCTAGGTRGRAPGGTRRSSSSIRTPGPWTANSPFRPRCTAM